MQFDAKRPIRPGRTADLIGELVDLARRVEGCATGPVDCVLFKRSPELLTVWLNAQEEADPEWGISQVYTLDLVSPQSFRAGPRSY